MTTVTTLEVIENAYRRLGIKAEDTELTADEYAYGLSMLNALYIELTEKGALPFGLESIPKEYQIPLANLLAFELGPSFSINPGSRGAALLRFMAMAFPDDRPSDQIEAPAVYY